ncbi:MAG: hypothetical protein CK425_00130 [Parachlamydia sp.]|nr:MAG: hypothetical protein CK425_00130 [Parachlamydia sp.]
MQVQFREAPPSANSYCSFDPSAIPEQEADKTMQIARRFFPVLNATSLNYPTLQAYLNQEEIAFESAFHLNVQKQPRAFVVAVIQAMHKNEINVDAFNVKSAIKSGNVDLLSFLLDSINFSLLKFNGIVLKNPLKKDDTISGFLFDDLIQYAIRYGNEEIIKCVFGKIPVSGISLDWALSNGDAVFIDLVVDKIEVSIERNELSELAIYGFRQPLKEGRSGETSFGTFAQAVASLDLEAVKALADTTRLSLRLLKYAEEKQADEIAILIYQKLYMENS